MVSRLKKQVSLRKVGLLTSSVELRSDLPLRRVVRHELREADGRVCMERICTELK